jgi:rRNA-processing protein FCF1
MNVLFDTNLLIEINSYNRPMDNQVAEMLQNVSKLSFHIFVHGKQNEDFQRDRDDNRKVYNLSRMSQFEILDNPPIPTEHEIDMLHWNNHNANDYIDNVLLFALYKDAVHLLVTNDNKLRNKAIRCFLADRLMTLSEFCVYLKGLCGEKFSLPAGIQERYVYQLDSNSTFWDSLSEDYPNFKEWYSRVSQDHRKAWCVLNDKLPLAICIYKENEPPERLTDNGLILDGPTLKICTFKVSEEVQGRKYGERMLFTAFQFSYSHNYKWIYLHMAKGKQEHLKLLCQDFGFEFRGVKTISYNRVDEIYVKAVNPSIQNIISIPAIEFLRKYYPSYREDSGIRKFIVPIRPGYHTDLFPDVDELRNGLFGDSIVSDNPQSNTIRKAYICKGKNNAISPGDIILFYRSRDKRNVQVIGVVETVLRTRGEQELNKVMGYVSKRTVYTKAELQEMLKGDALIILFQLVRFINDNDSSLDLKSVGIKGPVQTIRQITDDVYAKLIGK